ncbi:MAG: hypothetical protein FJ207_09985 [Gemmatimonadetes bacterium]|nr:hypothetical protein [Gemmatimonadota bacterium]
MPRVSFDDLPDHGRLWVFPASRDLSEAEARACLDAVDDFLDSWSAHGAPLRSGRALVDQRFLLVGVDEDAGAPSGCSIDKLVNRLKALGSELGVQLIDHTPVWFRDGDGVRTLPRAEFRALAAAGTLPVDVPVFDTTLTRIAQMREAGLERPASASWHGKAFFRAPAAR